MPNECEFCRLDKNYHCSVIHFDGDNGCTLDVQMPFGQIQMLYQQDDKTIFNLDFDINYCPMCGRKIGDNNAE